MAKAIQLCAAGLASGVSPAPASYPITIHIGANLVRSPANQSEAEATVRDLLALGADFDAGPLGIAGRDFATYGITPATVFDACALAHVEDGQTAQPITGLPSISTVAALVRRAFGARVTDTIRPMSAAYGARYSWHKYGQAIDFVPAGGVHAINRDQIRALMAQNGIRLIELLGPGDPGHSNHWHMAFARPGQILDRTRPIEEAEDWFVDLASTDARTTPQATDTAAASASTMAVALKPPPQWDVFATAAWRASKRGGS